MAMVLRPMNLGEIFDRSFEIYRKNLLLFIGIAAIPELAILGLHLADNAWLHFGSQVHPSRQPGIFLWQLVLAIGYYHISGFVELMFVPAYVNACSSTLFDEQRSTVKALRFTVARWRSYLWIAFLKHLSQLLIPEILAAALMFGIGTAEDKLGLLNEKPPVAAILMIIVPPVLLFICLFLWAGSCLALSMPAAALEQMKGFKALRRSWSLSKDGRLRITFAWVSISAITWIVMFTLQMLIWRVIVYVYRMDYVHRFNRMHYAAAMQFLYAVIVAVAIPIYPIALTLLYYDQRMRREGFDIEKMMESAGLMEAPATGEDEVNGSVIAETAGEGI